MDVHLRPPGGHRTAPRRAPQRLLSEVGTHGFQNETGGPRREYRRLSRDGAVGIQACRSLLADYSLDEQRAFTDQLAHSTYGCYALGRTPKLPR